PLENEALWYEMYRRVFRFGHKNHIILSALSVIDNALWDLKGKHFGMPVYRLLGGPAQEKVRVYGSLQAAPVSWEPEVACEQARAIKAAGFTAQKWGLSTWPHWSQKQEHILRQKKLAKGLRETLGADYDLLFDAGLTWDLPHALRMSR